MSEVVRAVKSARAAEPSLAEDDLLALAAERTGTPARLIRAAVRSWASYTEEIDTEIVAAEVAGESAEDAWRRERRLAFSPSWPHRPWPRCLILARAASTRRALVTANIEDFFPLDARYRAPAMNTPG